VAWSVVAGDETRAPTGLDGVVWIDEPKLEAVGEAQ
jgi:hypothetical protein